MDKHMTASFDRHVVVIGQDCTAFFFADKPYTDKAETKPEKPQTFSGRVLAEFKSFLPKVSRVKPVTAKLSSGRKLQIIAPHDLQGA